MSVSAPSTGGGSGSTSSGCYVKDVESGKTLLPYRYTGTPVSDVDSIL